MKSSTLSKSLVIPVFLATAFAGGAGYSAVSEATATRPRATPHVRSEAAGASMFTAQITRASDVVTEWNQQAITLTLLPASALTGAQQARAMAIVQVAVHDAVNGITKKYETYLSPGPAADNTSPEAAAIAAAHHALRNLFSSQAESLDAAFESSLAAHGLSQNDPGIAYGRSAAAAILALRANDHSAQAQFDYNAPGAGAPGVWVRLNNAPAQLPGWGNVTPFVLRSGSQFRPDPPPSLDSKLYPKNYNEIKAIGSLNSSTRTNEQTQIAMFWRATASAIWNPVLSQVIATRNLSLSATARIFALFYLAASDANVACWDAKYTYNFWRPITAIKSGDSDGNESTTADGAWAPLLATPPHPEYPSAHATVSSAMATILESMFDDNPSVPIAVTLTGITRQWHTFSEAVDEVIEARIYSGIHFRNSDEVGARLGRKVGRFVLNHALRRCPKGGCS
ncbi:MAG TPA: vanadium-dependent haloperoxidase [Blastocatellia bacterium]|nr:vanadium-dependent haloperoxidase [Blastocatellia bacterium]